MNLVDEQHILLPERYQNAGKITCPRECRSARVLEPHIKFHGNDLCECCLAQTRRAVEQAVVQRLFAAECSLDKNVQVVPQLLLSYDCLLYTSDAADDLLCVDLGGRRI